MKMVQLGSPLCLPLVWQEAELIILTQSRKDHFSATQDLTVLPFTIIPLNWLRKEKTSFSRHPLNLQGFWPQKKNQLFHRLHHNTNEAPTGSVLMGDTSSLAVKFCFVQARGTRLTEANKVISEVTTGAEGVESPLPSYYPASTVHL